MPNNHPGLSFYRTYFREDDGRSFFRKPIAKRKEKELQVFFEKKNKALYSFRADYTALDPYADLDRLPHSKHFTLQTTYPGLLIGTGYAHGIRVQGAAKIGFYFDHTTGLPVIPGSSVKGVLRSVFPQRDQKNSEREDLARDLKDAYRETATGKIDYLTRLIGRLFPEVGPVEEEWVLRLEAELFAGSVTTEAGNVRIPMAQRFVCHDAVVAGVARNGPLFGADFITPHLNRQDDDLAPELKNPIPIQLLKVMPDVQYRFRFQVYGEYRIKNEAGEVFTQPALLSPDQVVRLCRAIILEQGIGAKTHVGYGALMAVDGSGSSPGPQKATEVRATKQSAPEEAAPAPAAAVQPQHYEGLLSYKKNPHLMDAVVTKVDYRGNHVEVYLNTPRKEQVLLTGTKEVFDVGELLKVNVYLTKKGKINAANYAGK